MFQLSLAEHLVAGHERVLVPGCLAGGKSPFTASDFDHYAHFLKEPGRRRPGRMYTVGCAQTFSRTRNLWLWESRRCLASRSAAGIPSVQESPPVG
jgi:hypothetical protein